MVKLFSFLFFTGFIVAGASAQSDVFDFKVYGFEEGISHRNVFKITQDERGFIWAGTINGLNRFDGERFLPVPSPAAPVKLPFSYINELEFHQDNELILAGPGNLSILNKLTATCRNLPIPGSANLKSDKWTVEDLAVGADGSIWFSVESPEDNYAGLFVVRPGKQPAELANTTQTGAGIPFVLLDSLVLAAMERELILLDGSGKIKVKSHLPPPVRMLPGNIVDIQGSSKGGITVLTSSGEIFYSPKGDFNFKYEPVSSQLPTDTYYDVIMPDDNKSWWVGGRGSLWYYDGGEGALENFHDRLRQIVKNTCTVRQIFRSSDGVIWAATDFGLVKIARNNRLFQSYLNEGNDYCNNGFCSMRGITEDDQGRIYFSYYNSIHVLDPASDEVRPLFPSNGFSLLPYGLLWHENELWTGNGLRISLQSLKTEHHLDLKNTDAGVVMKDFEGHIWTGQGNTIYITNPSSGKTKTFTDSNAQFHESENDISFLLQGKKGNHIWIGTNNQGLYKVEKHKGVLAHYKVNNTAGEGLPSERILGITEDSKGENLWIATANGLVNFQTGGPRFKTFTVEDGLPNNFINGVLMEGDSVVWASTDNGLTRFSVATGRFKNFFTIDGLSANEFNRISCHKAANGRMYFGGLNGINAFYPANPAFRRSGQKINLPLLLTGFSKYNDRKDTLITLQDLTGLSKQIILSPGDRFFTFEFALADYHDPASVTYSYRLEGYEETWSKPTTDNFARYNNIAPGNYKFKVKAVSGTGGVEAVELVIPLSIEPPFYKEWWFIILCAVVFIVGGYLVLRWREYNLRRRQAQLEKEVKQRTTELEHEKQKSEELLLNILPAEMAEELKVYGKAKARRYEAVTVLFTDFRDFTRLAERMEPEDLVMEIDLCFREFDFIIEKYGLEKIKTMGDSYMCAAGLLQEEPSASALNVVRAGLEMQAFMKRHATAQESSGKPHFDMRLGIHTGPVVAGIVGVKKFAYDIWGSTVNIASRMETQSKTGEVNVSEVTMQLVENEYGGTFHGTYETRHLGKLKMYFIRSDNTISPF